MSMLLKKAQRHADAAPFLQPVSAEDVPDYYSIIIVSWSEWLARLGGVGALGVMMGALVVTSGRAVSIELRPVPHSKPHRIALPRSMQDPMDLGTMEQRLQSRTCERLSAAACGCLWG